MGHKLIHKSTTQGLGLTEVSLSWTRDYWSIYLFYGKYIFTGDISCDENWVHRGSRAVTKVSQSIFFFRIFFEKISMAETTQMIKICFFKAHFRWIAKFLCPKRPACIYASSHNCNLEKALIYTVFRIFWKKLETFFDLFFDIMYNKLFFIRKPPKRSKNTYSQNPSNKKMRLWTPIQNKWSRRWWQNFWVSINYDPK